MPEELQTTLYDLFGYLIPGFVATAALVALFWCLFQPDQPLLTVDLNWFVVILVSIAAYMLGHVVQAVANRLPWTSRPAGAKYLSDWPALDPPPADKGTPARSRLGAPRLAILRWRTSSSSLQLPAHLLDLAAHEAHVTIEVGSTGAVARPLDGKKVPTTDAQTLFEFYDEMVGQRGVPSRREIYLALEGFYRGLHVAGLLLAISLGILFIWTVLGNRPLRLTYSLPPISAPQLLFFLAISILALTLSFQRYERFQRYRVQLAVLAFLILRKTPHVPQE